MSFNYGDRVVIRTNGKYKMLKAGMHGTVKSRYDYQYTVQIDGHENPRSAKGYFYFTEKQLEILKEENNIMEGNYRIADVQFIEGANKTEVYAYACYDEDVYVDDICVVKSANHGFGIAKVVRLRAKTDETISREIVCKADFSTYNKRVADRAKQAELKKLMAARASKLQELSMYELLAKSDPEMAELLGKYKEIG